MSSNEVGAEAVNFSDNSVSHLSGESRIRRLIIVLLVALAVAIAYAIQPHSVVIVVPTPGEVSVA